MKERLIYTLVLCCLGLNASAQFAVTAHQEGWEDTPPQAVREGFYLQKRLCADMDHLQGKEEVLVFGRDNGHYPTFDLFQVYYVILDRYSKEVKFMSDVYVNDTYDVLLEDRNDDGLSELYISYFKDGKFSVDQRGYNLKTQRCYDRIECTAQPFKSAE